MRRELEQLLIIACGTIATAIVVAACATAGGPRHLGTVSIASAHAVLSTVQDTEKAIVCGQPQAPVAPACVTPDQHQQISAQLVTAFDYDERIARAVRALPPTAALPSDVTQLLGELTTIVNTVLGLIPSSPAKTQLVAKIGG